MAKWIINFSLFVTIVLMMAASSQSADWTLVVAHSNDLWFQLDEVQSNDKPCYKPLPPPTEATTVTTTEATTTTTVPTTSTTASTTTTTTETTTTTSIETTTTTSTETTTVTSRESTTATEITEETSSTMPGNATGQERAFVIDDSSERTYFEDEAGKVHQLKSSNTSQPGNSTVSQANVVDSVSSSTSSPSETTPHFASAVNSTVPFFAGKVNTTVPHFADKVNSTVPHFGDKVNSTVPHFADKVNSTLPHFADKVNSTIPFFADKVNSSVPHFADKINSTVPHFADKITTIVPVQQSTTRPASSKTPPINDQQCYGGVARHRTKVSELKKQSLDAGKGFLHLNAGGWLGGSIWFPILGSGPAADSIAMLDYDAVALGYRDFDEGVEATAAYLRELKNRSVTVLCANMDVSGEPSMAGLFQKSKVFEIQGRKIGVVGYIGKDADTLADTGKIKFEDEVTAIEREIKILFGQEVGMIIALGSAGYDGGKSILEKLLDIDLVINGGGKSVFQWNDKFGPLGETPVDSYPYSIPYGGSVYERLLATTSRYGKYIGRLEMQISQEGRIQGHSRTNPVLLGSDVKPEDELQKLVDEWERTVLIQSNETLGVTKVPIISNIQSCWYGECTGASMMADAARWFLEHNVTTNNGWSDSIAACVWHGGALSNTDLGINPGPISVGDILTMFPYANLLTMARMKGSDIAKLFEQSVAYYNDSSAYQGEFLHVSGMRVKFDLSQSPGNRVVSIMIRDTSNPSGNLAHLNNNNTYRICMPSFIARGGSRYAFMEDIKHDDTGIRDEEALKAYIKWTTPLAYGNDGRLQFVSPSSTPEECPHVDVVGTVFLTIFLTLLFAGMIFAAYKYLYPKLRERRGSLLSLIR